MCIYIYIVVVTKGLKHCWGTAVVISSDGARNQTLLLFLVHPGAGPLRPDGPPSTFNHVSFSPPSNPLRLAPRTFLISRERLRRLEGTSVGER